MKIGFTLFVLCCAFHLQAQHFIEGIARDSDTRQSLPHCVITVINTAKGTITDDYGKFEMEVNTGDQLVFSYVGYRNDTLQIEKEKTEYEILLKPIPAVLDEVVVTAVARTGLIKENPISISNVTPKMIERSNENNIIDVLAKNTPGLNALKTGPNISKPFIRGMGFNRVLTLYDGVRQEGQQWGGEHGLEIDNYNIERAEVIKGPASLVYGSDALAGVVSLLPFVPKENDGLIRGRWLSEYQSNNGLIGNGFRLSSGSTHWLWVARGSYRIAKNYSNDVDGRIFNTGFQEKNISALLGYKSSGGYSHFNLSLYDNLQGIPDGSRDSLTRKFTKQIFEGVSDDIKNRPIVSNSELNSYGLNPLHQRIQHYRAYVNNHYEIGKGDVSVLVALTQNIRREFNHPTAPEQAGTYLRLNTINYSVRYNAPEFAHMETSVGFNGMFQNNKNKDATNFPVPNYDLSDFGAFGVAKWKKEKWTVIGGARVDVRNIRTFDFYSRTDATGFDRQVPDTDTTGTKQQFTAINQSFHGISLSIGTTYQLNQIINLKFNFSRGYRAPSISEIAANGLDAGAHILYIGNPNFVSEFSWQEDFGLFVNFSEVSASVSLFNKNIENFIYLNQVTDAQGKPLADAQGNKTFQYQQAAAQLYGLEGTFSWKPKDIAGFSFSNQVALCYGFNRNPLFENKRQQGEYLPFIPPARWVSNITQEFELKSKWFSSVNVSAEMDLNANQNRFLELFNTETATPGYALLNISAGATIHQSPKTNWQFQLQMNNALDVVYQSNMSRLKYFEYYQQTPNGRSGIYSMGRNFCAKIIFSF
jgi:iron complex outermembrane receptor protein